MKEAIHYKQDLISLKRQELIDQLERRLSAKRFSHVLAVEATGIELAKLYHVDLEEVSIVCLLHDYAREMDPAEMLRLAKCYYPADDLSAANEGIWHGPAAAEIARTQMQVHSSHLLDAIAFHTTGWYQMSDVAKILYLADYIEPSRDFKGIDKMRKLAYQDLDRACYRKQRTSIKHLMKKQMYIYPLQILIYNHWTERINLGQSL